jgi:hypothetical protein
MPRRTTTRAQNRTQSITEEHAQNQSVVEAEAAERDKPPPF